MSIPKGNRENFETLKRAIIDGRVALMEVLDTKTGEILDAVCAVNDDDNGNYEFVPLAFMMRGNPYERLCPPDANGGFHGMED